jgi:NAD(P)-dependent dehydrogenase (short-subunit alcohol dehydrogenase family)
VPILEEFRLDGKTALLAGNAGGYLPDLAEVLAEAGAHVAVASDSEETAALAVEAASKHDAGASAIVAELSSEAGASEIVSQLIAGNGEIDILVNSFRTDYFRPLLETPASELGAMFGRDLRPVLFLCRAVGEGMVARQSGRIVNITSVLADRAMPNSVAVSVAQGGVLQLTRSLALEWGRSGVRVNAIGLGWFSTTDASLEEQQQEQMVRYIPLRRRGHPRDIAPLLAYFCSDACEYTTGQPVYVDGGLMARP